MGALEITAVGDRVIVEGRNRGTVRAAGRDYEHERVMAFAVRGGKIVRNWHYLIRRMYWWRFAGSNNIRSAFLYGFRPA